MEGVGWLGRVVAESGLSEAGYTIPSIRTQACSNAVCSVVDRNKHNP